jgi:hypothetical protein
MQKGLLLKSQSVVVTALEILASAPDETAYGNSFGLLKPNSYGHKGETRSIWIAISLVEANI